MKLVGVSSRQLCEWILFLCLVFLSYRNFDDADGWWHLKTGEQIVSTASIPQIDIFSATKSGEAWVTHEWLTETLMYGLFRAGGFGLVTFTFCLISATGFWIAYRRCPGRPFIAAIPLMMGVAAAAPMLGARPQVLSILLVSIFASIQARYAASRDAKNLWLLVGLMLVWVNLHGAFILGPMLIVLQMAGLLLDRWFLLETAATVRNGLRQLALTLLGCIAVVPLNPSGSKLFLYSVETLSRQTERLYLADWASPNFHLLRFQLFAVLILVGLASAALCRQRIRPSEGLTFVAFAFLGLQSVRHIPLFVVVCIPLLVTHLRTLLSELGLEEFVRQQEERPALRRLNAAILLLAISLMGYRIFSFTTAEASVERETFPRAAVDFIQGHELKGPLFNLYEWGGYLIWNLHPYMKVYVDGRPEIYGDAFIQEYVDCYFGRKDWRSLLDRSQIQTVLIEPAAPLSSLLRESPEWEKVFEDRLAIVFVRRSAPRGTSSLNETVAPPL